MKLVLYTHDYCEQLDSLLKQFSAEVWGEGTADVDSFVSGHWCIYLALNSDGNVIGFSSYILNTYFGLRPMTLGNTYIYVEPEHRTSKTMYLFSLQSGKIAMDNRLNLEHYYGSDSSLKLSSKIKGAKVYETWMYDIGEVEKTFNRLQKTIRIR